MAKPTPSFAQKPIPPSAGTGAVNPDDEHEQKVSDLIQSLAKATQELLDCLMLNELGLKKKYGPQTDAEAFKIASCERAQWALKDLEE